MYSTDQPTPRESSYRRRRRRIAPPIGIVAGAVGGIVVAAVIELLAGSVTTVAYLGAALLGGVFGLVLAMLVPAELDDGADDARVRGAR
jgi:hypothetical protein